MIIQGWATLDSSAYENEWTKAVMRSLTHGLITAPPVLDAAPYLTNESVRSEIAASMNSRWQGTYTGLCHLVVSSCIEQVIKRLDCKAWVTFGYLTDIDKPGKPFWKMDPELLCHGLTGKWIGMAEFHTWMLLDSGEIIDPVFYPTLAEIGLNSQGAGRCNIHAPDGRPYRVIPGLPVVRYHPSAFMAA